MITVVHTSDLRRPFLSADCHIGDADVTGFFFEKTCLWYAHATLRFATATKRSLVLQGLVPRSRFLQICRCYNTLHPKRNDQKSFCGSERCDTEIFLQKQAWFCRLPERARRAILHNLQKQASFCGWLQKQSCFCRQISGWRRGLPSTNTTGPNTYFP